MIAIYRWIPPLVLVSSAAAYVIGVLLPEAGQEAGRTTYDTHSYFVPNMLYAWRSIEGGSGLLWNPYQNCGQPFLAISTIGLLYPPHLFFHLLEFEWALAASLILHLSIASLGTYCLGRELRLGRSAALCGAIAFGLGSQSLKLASWSPIHIAALAWLPVAVWRAERAIRSPSLWNATWLGGVVALQILPGFPQLVFFTGQLIVLRLAWTVLRRETPRPAAAVLATCGGLLLAVSLCFVQLLPSIELAGESYRSGTLSRLDMGEGYDWDSVFANLLSWPYYLTVPLVAALCGAAVAARERRADALFFAGVAGLYLLLSFGPGTPLFELYAALPFGGAFRDPSRFVWCVSFALALLAAHGAAAVAGASEQASARGRWLLFGGALAGVLLYFAVWRLRELPPPSAVLEPTFWGLCALGLGLIALVLVLPRLSGLARFGLPMLLLGSSLAAGAIPYLTYRQGVDYESEADSFEAVRSALTPQERAFAVGAVNNFGLMPKSGSLLRVPTIWDFEPQTSRAWAEYFTYMALGRSHRGLEYLHWGPSRVLASGLRRPLLDLTAARFVLVERRFERPLASLGQMRRTHRGERVSVFENLTALPRAFFVSRVRVLPEAEILPALAAGADPRQAALVSRAPRSGFTGAQAPGAGSARIDRDLAEHLVVSVESTQPGFLFLADQYAPGWRATVDGEEAEILRANHAFRLVEVPAGASAVEFRYRPTSLRVGGAVSAASVLLVAGLGFARFAGSRTRVLPPGRG